MRRLLSVPFLCLENLLPFWPLVGLLAVLIFRRFRR